MKLKAILNRDGGTFRTTDMDLYVQKLNSTFTEAGHQIEVAVASGSDMPGELARASKRDDLDAILAGGGDGTISAAAGIAWANGMPLGIIPAGTMNLFARSLGLPLDIWEVLDVLAKGEISHSDIGSVDGRAFVHQFSAGMHARMVRYRNLIQYSSRAGKMIANIRASVGVVMNPPRFMVEYDLDGFREKRKISAVSVSNNPFGDNGLMYSDDVTTGHLGFYLADPLEPAGAARLALDILRGKLRENTTVTTMTGQELHLHFPHRRDGAQCVVDGELIPLGSDVDIKLHPGELKVLVPPKADQAEKAENLRPAVPAE